MKSKSDMRFRNWKMWQLDGSLSISLIWVDGRPDRLNMKRMDRNHFPIKHANWCILAWTTYTFSMCQSKWENHVTQQQKGMPSGSHVKLSGHHTKRNTCRPNWIVFRKKPLLAASWVRFRHWCMPALSRVMLSTCPSMGRFLVQEDLGQRTSRLGVFSSDIPTPLHIISS